MASLRVRTVVLALGQFVHTGMTLVLAVVLSRLLDKETYGTFRQVLFIYMVLGVLGSGIAESLLYFLPRAKERDKARWLGQTAFLSLCVGLMLGAIIYATADLWAEHYATPRLTVLLKVFAFFPITDRLIRLVPPALIAEDQAQSAALFTMLLGVVKLASAIVPCVLGLSLEHIFWSMNICWAVMAVVGVISLASRIGVAIRIPTRADLMEQLSYLFPLAAAGVVFQLQELFGHHVVLSTLSAADYADYVNGAIQLPLVGIWTYSISAAIMPDLVRLGDAGKSDEMLALWQRAFRKGALVIFPVAAATLIIADQAIVAVYGAEYLRSAIPFAIYLLVLPIRAVNFSTLFRAVGRNRSLLTATAIGLAANATVTLTLVWLGKGTELVFYGPAIGYLAGSLGIVLSMVLMLRKMMGRSILGLVPVRELAPLGLLAVAAAAIAVLTRLLPVESWVAAAGVSASLLDTATAIVRCVLAMCVFGPVFVGLGWVARVFDDGERALMMRVLRLGRR